MRKTLAFAVLLAVAPAWGATLASVQSGSSTNSATWGGTVPQQGDSITIQAGHSVDWQSSSVASLAIQSGGTLTGNISINDGGSAALLGNASTVRIAFQGNASVSGNPTIGTIALVDGLVSFTSTPTVVQELQIYSATVTMSHSPVYLPGSLLRYYGPDRRSPGIEWTTGTTPGAPGVPYNVYLRDYPSSAPFEMGPGNRTIGGDLTIYGGLFAFPQPIMWKTAFLATPDTLTVHGTIINSPIIAGVTDTGLYGNGGTVHLTKAGSIALQGYLRFHNLVVDAGSTVVDSSRLVTISGTIQGSIEASRTISAPGSFSFGGTGASMNITSVGTLSNITVTRVGGSHPNAGASEQTGNYWQIAATGSGFTTSLTLPHTLANPANATVCRYDGSAWDCGVTSFTATTVTREGVTQFSPWAVGDTSSGVNDWSLMK